MMPVNILRIIIIAFITFGSICPTKGQHNNDTSTIKYGRLAGIISLETTVISGSLIGLNDLWYKNYPRTNFHFFNDNNEWLQMDKAGHLYSAYQLSSLGYSLYSWAGVNKKKSLLFGGTAGSLYLLTIEMLDGFSSAWGFSLGDLTANISGTGLFLIQQSIWDEQRIILKYSYFPSKYAKYNPDLLGNSFTQQFLKDYNGQTYWASVNIKSFYPGAKIPGWFCMSLGYGASGMTGGNSNPPEVNGQTIPDFERSRQFLLSADIDFTKIKTRSHFLKSIFYLANFVKLPFPALEVNNSGKLKGHFLYF